MTNPVDDIFLHEVDREDSLDVMLGTGYDDLIDLVANNVKSDSIFDPEEDKKDEESEEEENEDD